MISTAFPFVTSTNSVQALRLSKDERRVFQQITIWTIFPYVRSPIIESGQRVLLPEVT